MPPAAEPRPAAGRIRRVHALAAPAFQLIRPKIVVCLGRVAAQRMLDPTFSISRDHGKFFDKQGTLFMATYHPAALLRYPDNKPAVFGDFVALRQKITESATIPIKNIPPDARREAAWSLKRWH